ncbi:MAG: hypothetical protein FWE31_02470 [Firmicutes bacterium]|nr:hypothetical protein [Bacillota bacterium]
MPLSIDELEALQQLGDPRGTLPTECQNLPTDAMVTLLENFRNSGGAPVNFTAMGRGFTMDPNMAAIMAKQVSKSAYAQAQAQIAAIRLDAAQNLGLSKEPIKRPKKVNTRSENPFSQDIERSQV